jgi:hypothetical protein
MLLRAAPKADPRDTNHADATLSAAPMPATSTHGDRGHHAGALGGDGLGAVTSSSMPFQSRVDLGIRCLPFSLQFLEHATP